ncbi:MAG: hypothetical protein COA74_12950 [Gammaproteobacteria bacterium]|nr:MAG: hypothetical protein COA74_12950 [Gammaproteobacteria bacterium]
MNGFLMLQNCAVLFLSITVLSIIQFLTLPAIKGQDGVNATEIILAADNVPPYVYLNERGEMIGTLVPKLSAIFQEAGIKHRFMYTPWNRAMSDTLNKTNVFMFPLSRTKVRENRFEWIVPLQETSYRLYGFKGDFDPQKIDITSGDYMFVCQETTVLCTILRSFGIPEKSIVKKSSIEISQIAKMLKRGRIDFLILTESGLETYTTIMGVNVSDMVVLDKYSYQVVEYLAGNKNIDKTLLLKLRSAALILEKKQLEKTWPCLGSK